MQANYKRATTVLLNELVCGLCEPTCRWLPYGGACSRLAAVHRCSSTSTEAFIIQPVIDGLVQPRLPPTRLQERCPTSAEEAAGAAFPTAVALVLQRECSPLTNG